MENLKLYDALSIVPNEAKRTINAGRLKGMTDINPMWRIKIMTETFGPCGIGWKYEITRQWSEPCANNEISAYCDILLYIKYNGEWSEGIPGTGGSAEVAKEKNGLHTSDECYKMALTDAISVACKALGVAAKVYWEKDPTKYIQSHEQPPTPKAIDKVKQEKLSNEIIRVGGSVENWVAYVKEKCYHGNNAPKSIAEFSEKAYSWSMGVLSKRANKEAATK
jgi:hypothetical protein